MMEDNRIFALGRLLGTAEDGDQDGSNEDVTFYDFVPADGCNIPSGNVTINFYMGTYILEGSDTAMDIVPAVVGLPRASEADLKECMESYN